MHARIPTGNIFIRQKLHVLRYGTHWNAAKLNELIKKSIALTDHEDLLGSWRSGFHILQAVGSQMAVRLSALRAGRALLHRVVPGTHIC
jgi:hypothetical protein